MKWEKSFQNKVLQKKANGIYSIWTAYSNYK